MARLLALFLCCLLPSFSTLAAAVINIDNQTDSEIINILINPVGEHEDFFIRLDLAPNAQSEIQNPQLACNLRVDTGLKFWFFDDVNLQTAQKIAFCGEHPVCLVIDQQKHLTGREQNLIPQQNELPVCELTDFRPNMTMNEVCRILPEQTPRDDNGAMLAGLGFGNLVWAGRLAPAQDNTANPVLEHMELRRPFVRSELEQILKQLYSQGYVPWQLEFPDAELDFADMPDRNLEDLRNVLNQVLNKYLDSDKTKQPASIMLAPAGTLDKLNNADAPQDDVQLFTLTLKPKMGVIILDVAAYSGTK